MNVTFLLTYFVFASLITDVAGISFAYKIVCRYMGLYAGESSAQLNEHVVGKNFQGA